MSNFPDSGISGGKRASRGALFRVLSKASDRLLIAVLLAAVCLFVLYPMLCLFLRSLQSSGGGWGFSQYAAVWTQYADSLKNSIFVGIFTSVFCTLLSFAAALTLATRRGWLRWVLLALILITMVSPPFVSSLAYIQLYGRRGWITYRLLGLSWNPYNRWGVIAMQCISFAPLNILFFRGLIGRLDTDSLRAAQDLGAPPRAILRDIVLPQLRPGFLVALLLSLIRSLADFGTPIIIGGRFSTIAADIYLQIVGYSNLEKAAAMNMILMLPTIAAFFLYRRWMGKTQMLSDSGRARRAELRLPLHRCGAAGVLSIVVSAVLFLVMAMQYACIFAGGFLKSSKGVYSFTTQYLVKLFQRDGATMLRSVEYALFVAVVGSLFAMLFAYYMDRRRIPGRNFFDCVATLPYMIPGTCFGIGYILAFHHAPLKLTGTAVIVLMNMLFKQLPTTTKLCSAALTQIPVEWERAAQDLGGSQLAVIWDVILPNLRPAFLQCFIYNFSSSMTTAGAILFLIDAGHKLAVFQLFDAVYTGEYAMASLIATAIILIVLLVEGLVYLIMRKGAQRHVF